MSNDLYGFFNPDENKYVPQVRKKKKKKRKDTYINFLLYEATSKQFYRSKAWKRLRVRVFEEYPRVCMCCGDSESVMHVDHIEPRSLRPKLALTFMNLQVLCEWCNMEKSNIHAEDYREEAAERELDREHLMKTVW